ncbi:hypothetical protein CRYPA_1562 [uncultured Candidatus Thioglobus sp.]|nr:hypothetical protein CRYPA_1562 [uncultured Candidatus Thioglobus sp.]
MQQVLYFYEGECEEKLLKFLKHKEIIKSGKTTKFNLWQDKIKQLKRLLPRHRKSELYFLIDTDKLANIQLFKDNLENLKQHNICLIVQYKNLEDELSYICDQTRTELFSEFNACNKDEFTSKFIKASNLQSKLNSCDFSKIWSRGTDFMQKNSIEISKNCKYRL